MEKSREVITKCIEANECNMGLWEFYLHWTLSNDYIAKHDEDKTKEIFEQARSKIGNHPKAWNFWKKYAGFEAMRDNKNTTNLIYYTALCAGIDNIDELMLDYRTFLNDNFDKLKELISSENPQEFKDEKPTLLNHFCEAANDKDNFIKIIEGLAEKAKEKSNKRSAFENALTISTYSLSNVSNPDLKIEKETWKSYIQSEKSENNYQNVQMLYKRMLVPFYDDFSIWKEYIDYLSNTMSQVDKCRTMYKNLRENPMSDNNDAILEIYLSNAHFEEKQGQIKLARKIFKTINETLCPNLIKGIAEYIKFEQRVAGPKKNILDFLEDSLEKAIKKEDEFATIFLTVNTCRFHFANEQDLDLVFDIFSDSVKSFRNSKKLFLNLIKLLESIESTENKLYSRSFEIIKKGTLDTDTEFDVTVKKELATAYFSWLKRKCQESTYIELVESSFSKEGLIEGVHPPVPTLAPAPAPMPVGMNPSANGGVNPVQALPPAPLPAPVPQVHPSEVGYSGEKRAAEIPVPSSQVADEGHKRAKIEE